MSDPAKCLLATILCITALGIAGAYFDSEPDPCQNYREMRQIWEDSSHEYGWPEFEQGKDEECGYES